MVSIPKIVSVDDHVIEPPSVWIDRLPKRYLDVGPRVVDKPLKRHLLRRRGAHLGGGRAARRRSDVQLVVLRGPPLPDGAHPRRGRSSPRDELQMKGITYDEMIPGGVAAQVPPRRHGSQPRRRRPCAFPSWVRFCGQALSEGHDKELGLECVRAYNDWMVEEWCGDSGGRMIPLCLIPLWDAQLAAAEIRRNAARGVKAVAFSEIPHNLGLPVHSQRATGTRCSRRAVRPATVVCMHIGSGSKMPSTSPDAPGAVGSRAGPFQRDLLARRLPDVGGVRPLSRTSR